MCDKARLTESGSKIRVKIYWKICVLIFTEFGLKRKFLLFAIFLHKSHICEKSCSWDMAQNALGQLDFGIFKSSVSLEQNDEIAWFFACWYKFMEIKSWLNNIKIGFDEKWVWPLQPQDSQTKLAVSQEGISGMNGYFACWYKFKKA